MLPFQQRSRSRASGRCGSLLRNEHAAARVGRCKRLPWWGSAADSIGPFWGGTPTSQVTIDFPMLIHTAAWRPGLIFWQGFLLDRTYTLPRSRYISTSTRRNVSFPPKRIRFDLTSAQLPLWPVLDPFASSCKNLFSSALSRSPYGKSHRVQTQIPNTYVHVRCTFIHCDPFLIRDIIRNCQLLFLSYYILRNFSFDTEYYWPLALALTLALGNLET